MQFVAAGASPEGEGGIDFLGDFPFPTRSLFITLLHASISNYTSVSNNHLFSFPPPLPGTKQYIVPARSTTNLHQSTRFSFPPSLHLSPFFRIKLNYIKSIDLKKKPRIHSASPPNNS